MSSIKAKLQEDNPERVDGFVADVTPEVKKILANIKNYQVITESHTIFMKLIKAKGSSQLAELMVEKLLKIH